MAVLARLLVPADFGLMAVVMSMLVGVNLLTDLGLSRALIHFESISTDSLSSLYWINLFMGLAMSIAFASAAPLIGAIFKINGLTSVLIAVSPVLVLSAAGQQFRALAEKDLLFSTLGLIEIVSNLLGLAAAVVIALIGGGVFALVGAVLVTAASGSTLAWWKLSSGRIPRLHFRVSDVKPYIRYGGYLVGEGFANTARAQSDVLIAGLLVSPTALGLFSVTRDLSVKIGMVINPIITRVGFPVMSRLQDDILALKSVYLQTVRMTSSVNFPIYVALGLFADEIVDLLYGPQWDGAGLYLRILAAWGMVRSIGNPVGSLLHAVGALKRALVWNISLLLILPLLYWAAIGINGIMGLAVALVVLQIILVLPSWYFLVRPCCGAGAREFMVQLGAPLIISSIAGTASWMGTCELPHGAFRLVLGCAIGGVTYVFLSFHFNRRWFDTIRRIFILGSSTNAS